MTSQPRGRDAFLAYYHTVFPGATETAQFIATLSAASAPILRFHPSHAAALQAEWVQAGLSWQPLSWHPSAVRWPTEAPPGTPLPGYADHRIYAMNASSLLPVLALDPQPGERVLDACAAPGGKALFIADRMGGQGELIANDTSPNRRHRLQSLLTNYRHPWVTVHGKKAETIYRKQPNSFDRILLDAPCSSEKHVWNKPEHLAQWSPNRVKQLAQRQLALVSGLFEALAPGGRLVYATCAITPQENEAVIARLLKKKKGRAALVAWPSTLPHGNALPGFGFTPTEEAALCRILPHRFPAELAWDPMFIATITRQDSLTPDGENSSNHQERQ